MIYRIIFFLIFCNTIYSQTFTIKGSVTDSLTGEPVQSANVILQSTDYGTSSDIKGNFNIHLKKGLYRIQISFIGYVTKTSEIKLISDTTLSFALVNKNVLLQDVIVYSKNNSVNEDENVSAVTLQGKMIERVTSAIPDVLRSVQTLPGVTTDNSFSAKFNVRGGNYDENLVLVNDTQVYEPFHIKEADNVSVGIFNSNLIKSVNFIPGGFSAKYGDKLSSVLNIEYREGNKERFSGGATLSLTDLGGFFEGPLSSQTTFLLGLRKSYLSYALSILDVGTAARPDFYDIQGVVTHHFNPFHKIEFKFIHAGDKFTEDPGPENTGPYSYYKFLNGTNSLFTETFYNNEKDHERYFSTLLDLKDKFILGGKSLLEGTITMYNQIDDLYDYKVSNFNRAIQSNHNYFYKSNEDNLYQRYLEINSWKGNINSETQISPFYDLHTGFSYENLKYHSDLIDRQSVLEQHNLFYYPDITTTKTLINNVDPSLSNFEAHSFKLSGYTENLFQIENKLILDAGARFDYFDFNKDLTFSPRFSTSFKIDENTVIKAAWGIYYQSPLYTQFYYSFASDTNTQSQEAIHYILGVEKIIPLQHTGSLKIKVEGYYKNYNNLISSTRNADAVISYSKINDSQGYAAGLDINAALKLDDFYGWITYGLLFTKEKLKTAGSTYYPRYTDQRHTLSLVADYVPWDDWDLVLRFTIGSGYPYTPSYVKQLPGYNDGWTYVRGNPNSAYLPVYKRVDLRLERKISLFHYDSTIFLDVHNLFNFKNVQGYRYTVNDNGQPVTEESELFSILPVLGISVNFN
jgi:CarboxypepD_reg-like domain/TonB dependent receptor-like, beta-barrel/TonB-dependent Receptor Plug Domain